MKRNVVIAGKNDIAVEILEYILHKFKEKVNVYVTCNQTETGLDSWQRSLRLAARQLGVPECRLRDTYTMENLLFLSLEYDRLIKPEKFISEELYNIHFSLLPQYRGMYTSALPILFGEEYSGVTLHRIDQGIDTGDILEQKCFRLDTEETCRSLYLKYIRAGIDLVKKNLKMLLFYPDEIQVLSQNAEKASYFSKSFIDYTHLSIDLNQTACSIQRQIRAFSFREYQMPKIYGKDVIGSEITRKKSKCKPGTIVSESEIGFVLSTIDFDLIVYYDRITELIDACYKGDFHIVKEICAVKQHVNAVDKMGKSPIKVARACGHSEIVEYLLCRGAE